LIEAASIHEVEDGAEVVLEGDPGESMYLHHDGEVTIEKQVKEGKQIEITRLHR
jgi:CRP-like cAMP-binding protein